MLFGTAGIRGDLKRITPHFALNMGKSAAQFSKKRGLTIAVGRDGRTSSDMLSRAVVAGVLSEGVKVTDVGRIHTPGLAFAADECGIMVTASHNPPDNNGLKVFVHHRELFPHEEREIEDIVSSLQSHAWWNLPCVQKRDILPLYKDAVLQYIQKEFGGIHSGKKVVVDCGNGMGALVTPHILERMGCRIIPLYTEITGFFERPPEPSEKNISLLKEMVVQEGADLGIAHDGDADRINVVNEKGKVIPEDSLITFFAGYYVNPGDYVVTSLNTSFRIDEHVRKKGGITKRVMLGNIHEGVFTYNAVFAGEPWKHIHVKFGPWIDGVLSAAFLARYICDTPASQLCANINEYPLEKINIKAENREEIVTLFKENITEFKDIKDVQTTSGIRVNFTDGSWILVRPSGTEPKVRIIVEGITSQRFDILRKFVQHTLDESKSLYSIVN